MIDLRDYQRDAVDEVAEAIARLAPHDDADRLIVLEAPTGAGKTVIAAAALDRAAHNLATIWLTPDFGGLTNQSVLALDTYLDASALVVERLTQEWLLTHSAIEPGMVLVANWEKLIHTDRASGSRTNVFTRHDETRSLFEVLEGTAAAGTPLVIIIDESHWGKDASGTNDLLDEIDAITPALRVEASATPKLAVSPRLQKRGLHVFVEVELDRVIAEGMLAKNIAVNDGLRDELNGLNDEDRAGTTGESLVLETAWTRLNQLTERYQQIDSPVRPLMLVQIPDGGAGDEKLASVEEQLKRVGVSRENGLLAVWLSTDKTDNLAGIASFGSAARVLIFKQAVATGWDCPRAQVLVAFREMQSEIFSVQTVGRILRTPERRHYGDLELDRSYIYANIDAPTGPRDKDLTRPRVADVTLTRTVPELTLAGSYATRAGTFDDVKPGLFRDCFTAAADVVGLASKLPKTVAALEQLATDRIVGVDDVLDGDDRITAAGQDSVVVAVAEHDLQAAFDAFLAERLGGYRGRARSLPVMRQAIYDWVFQHAPTWWTGDDSDVILAVQRLIHTAAREHLGAAVAAAIARHREQDATISERAPTDFTWELQETLQVSSETNEQPPSGDGYAYRDSSGLVWRPMPSKPEEAIEAALAAAHAGGLVAWWWKNGEGDRRFFSVAYTHTDDNGDVVHATTYPDYIAELTPTTPEKRRIAVLEGKAGNDTDKLTSHKVAALKEWGDKQTDIDVVTGIVVPLPGGIALNDGTTYTNPRRDALTAPNSGWLLLNDALRT